MGDLYDLETGEKRSTVPSDDGRLVNIRGIFAEVRGKRLATVAALAALAIGGVTWEVTHGTDPSSQQVHAVQQQEMQQLQHMGESQTR